MDTVPFRCDATGLASAAACLAAGCLTSFTVSIGGELPLGELVTVAVAGWIFFCLLVTRSVPSQIPRSRLFRLLLVCQAVAFAAYVFSDLYRHSSFHDISRGWARMVFLAIDIVSIAYLFGCSRANLLCFLAGQVVGDALHALAFGALYGDQWKFGYGIPVTYLVFFFASIFGRPGVVAAALLMSGVHFALDFRSFGGICLVVAAATLITLFPRRARPWMLLPAAALVLGGLGAYFFAARHGNQHRATRSDVARSSMMIAAAEGFAGSPLIGQGSWFSKSQVLDNFLAIQAQEAAAEHVGGFPQATADPGAIAIHSQILVALAEGGIFGAAFFLVFGAALALAIFRLTFLVPGSRLTGIYLLVLVTALYNWMLSPFSGAHRVYIAVACGLLCFLPWPEPSPVPAETIPLPAA